MEQAELAALHERAETELTKIPGVAGVGFGLKEVAGAVTEQIAFRVYVIEKKHSEAVAPDERIPAEFGGIPTDVLTVPQTIPEPCIDMEPHNPLIGGITITTFKKDSQNRNSLGTLGFFATLNGVAGPENVVLVTNNHVLAEGGAVVGDSVYQPQWTNLPGNTGPLPDTGFAGNIHDMGHNGNFEFAYPSEAKLEYFIDCASVMLDTCISTWCHSNCGVSYKNEIRGLAILPPPPAPQVANSKIEGVARVVQQDVVNAGPDGYQVYKVGSTTSRTKGRVVDTMAVVDGTKQRAIAVDVIGVDCDQIPQFSSIGDSGAALINSANMIIGMHFAHDAMIQTRSYSCHIHPVLARLGITPISTVNPPVGPAGKTRADVEGSFADRRIESLQLRDRFLATPRGADLHARALRHSRETIDLVNRRRPVTIVWHRGGGPTFLAHAIDNLSDPTHRIPHTVGDVDRATLLRRMADVLREHGSAEMRAAIDEALDEILELAAAFDDDLRPLLAQFEREADVAAHEEVPIGAS